MNTTPFVEIERKFLIKPTLSLTGLRYMIASQGLIPTLVMEIFQGYLAIDPVEIRIGFRQDTGKDQTAKLCFKQGLGLLRTEIEQTVELDKANALYALSTARVHKWRYRFDRWEIDFYQDSLDGHVTAEVELSRVDEPTPPVPEWLAPYLDREVTDEHAFKNSALATTGVIPILIA